MENNRILRSPDVSVKTVTINSAYESAVVENVSPDTMAVVPETEQKTETLDRSQFEEKLNLVEPEVPDETLELARLEELSEELQVKQNELDKKQEQLEQAHLDLETEKHAYRESIYADVKQEVTANVEAEHKERNRQFIGLIDALDEKLKETINGVEDEMIAIVFESVCKIIGSHMKESSDVISAVREVMKHTQDRMEMKLRVSEKDYAILKDVKNELSAGMSNRIDIVADEHVRYGGCIIETEAGRIDGRLEQQLNSLMQLLLNVKVED